MQTVIDAIKEQVKPQMDIWVENKLTHIQKFKEDHKNDQLKIKEAGLLYSLSRSKELQRENAPLIATLHLKCVPYSNNWYQAVQMIYGAEGTELLRNNIEYSRNKIQKQADHKLKKIDHAVHKKVSDLDVVKIENKFFTPFSKDGFCEGGWNLTTKDGDVYLFSFECFFAGGFNIQCHHVRTKYKLKKLS